MLSDRLTRSTPTFARSVPAAPHADAIYQHYPTANYPTPRAALVAATTGGRFVCPSLRNARAAVIGQPDAPVYRYFFKHGLDHGAAQVYGAFHGLELMFVFGTLGVSGYVPSPSEAELASDMHAAWSNFAKTGDPGWPPYDATLDRTEVLDEPLASQDGIRRQLCDFWDTLAL